MRKKEVDIIKRSDRIYEGHVYTFLAKLGMNRENDVTNEYKNVYYSKNNRFSKERLMFRIDENFHNELQTIFFNEDEYIEVKTTAFTYDKYHKQITIWYNIEYVNKNNEFKRIGTFETFDNIITRCTDEKAINKTIEIFNNFVINDKSFEYFKNKYFNKYWHT